MEKTSIEYYASQIVDASLRVHKELGPGLLESVYTFCLADELTAKGIRVLQEVLLPLYYHGHKLTKEFRIDLLVEDTVIIEVKAVENLLPVHRAQLISYLKLADKRLGFLINFNVPVIKNGIHRYANKY